MFSKKQKLVALITASLLLAVSGIVFVLNKPKVLEERKIQSAHHGQISEISLKEVHIDAYYFVPKDQAGSLDPKWKQNIEKALKNSKIFYEYQTADALNINYSVFPKPLFGREESFYYNGRDTSNGNPSALLAIKSEIETRQKYDADFESLGFPGNSGTYRAMAIVYEGVGAASMLLVDKKPDKSNTSHVVAVEKNESPAFLVSNFFLNSSSYKDYGETIFAHELGHILGLSDAYEFGSESVTNDIMGTGRFRPLDLTYLTAGHLKQLGVGLYGN